MSKYNLFKPEDFYSRNMIQTYIGSPITGKTILVSDAVSYSNTKLNALIESWPVVTGFVGEDDLLHYGNGTDSADTHKAYLAFIEPIVKEECKHEPKYEILLKAGSDAVDYEQLMKLLKSAKECRHCGVELTATWSAK